MTNDTDGFKKGGDDGNHRIDADSEVETDLHNSESRTPLKTPNKEAEVKFIPGDSVNGDAKIDIAHVKVGFAGMSKDDLLKYVNDPFWVRTRMVLFVLFWLIWVGMFVAAIAIIVIAPRCEAPKPRKWFEEGPIVDIKLPKDGKGLGLVAERLPYLSDLKVKGIVLPSLFPSDEHGNAVGFKSVSKDFGTLEDLKNLLGSAKEKAIRVLLNFVPNHSSIKHEWFNKSVHRETPYDAFYVWAPHTKSAADGSPLPPNNWISVKGGSAWTWSPDRKEFYLHQLDQDQPDLNYHNPLVVDEIRSVFIHWLSLGVSGFNFDKVQYLLEDPELQDEEIGSKLGPVVGEYDFLSHAKTFNYPGVAEQVSLWRDLVKKETDNDGILVISGQTPIASNMNQTSEPDLVRAGSLTADLKQPLSLGDLVARTEAVAARGGWPALEATDSGQNVADLGPNIVDPLNIITMLLKGTPITRLGDEQGLTQTETDEFLRTGIQPARSINHYNLYQVLANARESHSVLYGSTNITLLNDATLVLTRCREGYPGFVAIWNESPENVTLDLSSFDNLPAELTLLASGDGQPPNSRVPTKQVHLQSNVAAVFTFVPAE